MEEEVSELSLQSSVSYSQARYNRCWYRYDYGLVTLETEGRRTFQLFGRGEPSTCLPPSPCNSLHDII